jgi:chromosomal replication initiator protein
MQTSPPSPAHEAAPDARSPFERAIDRTRRLSPGTFDQWFGGVQFDDLTDGVLTLRAQNDFVQGWVTSHFLPTLVAALREETGWAIEVRWLIDSQLERPIRPKVAEPPVRPRPLVLRPSSEPTTSPPLEAVGDPDLGAEGAPRSERPSRGPSPLERVRVGPSAPPPAPAPEGLNPRHTFASFVVGPSNQLAHAAAVAAAGGGGRRYNPLFICGGTGLGKTHLVHAIAHRVREERPSARILYVSAERFTNEYISAIQTRTMHEFRTRYRDGCDLLLVDDIQFLAGREQTQEEFFHTFNALHASDRPIVVTSDKYPQELQRMEERLVSRFSWGLVADIQGPELETRVAIVKNKAALEGISLPDDVALYLAQAVRSNIRELEGTLIRIAAKSSLVGRVVDLDFVKAEVRASGVKAQTLHLDDIQRAVCHHFQLRSTDLLSKDRHRSVAFARHVAMYLCKQRLRASFPEIGRAFGGRDHTTVMSAVRKIEAQREHDHEVRAHLEALEKKLAEG